MTAKVKAAEPSRKSSRAFLPSYFDILHSKKARERYLKKLQFVDGHDAYEIPRQDGSVDDLESWPTFMSEYICFSVRVHALKTN